MVERTEATAQEPASQGVGDADSAVIIEVSSPVCYADKAGDAYMGFLDRDSLVAELNILLEAERAGAQVAARLIAEAEAPELKDLAAVIQRDERRWCKMLIGALKSLDADPSPAVGDFYDQAMGIADIEARFAFVNRGQVWVIRKLKTLLPMVRDDQLHAALLGMLAEHDHNVTQVETILAGLVSARNRSGAQAS